MLTTQCEAEGLEVFVFILIDQMFLSKYTVRIEADKNLYPILLSNGNKKYSGNLNQIIIGMKLFGKILSLSLVIYLL